MSRSVCKSVVVIFTFSAIGKFHKSRIRHKMYPHFAGRGIFGKVYRNSHARYGLFFIFLRIVTGNKPRTVFFIRIFYKRIASSHFIAVYRNGVLPYDETHIVRLAEHFHRTPIRAEEFLRRNVIGIIAVGTAGKQYRRNKNCVYA